MRVPSGSLGECHRARLARACLGEVVPQAPVWLVEGNRVPEASSGLNRAAGSEVDLTEELPRLVRPGLPASSVLGITHGHTQIPSIECRARVTEGAVAYLHADRREYQGERPGGERSTNPGRQASARAVRPGRDQKGGSTEDPGQGDRD